MKLVQTMEGVIVNFNKFGYCMYGKKNENEYVILACEEIPKNGEYGKLTSQDRYVVLGAYKDERRAIQAYKQLRDWLESEYTFFEMPTVSETSIRSIPKPTDLNR